MFGRPKKQPTYKKTEVEYIIKEILGYTVDRKSIHIELSSELPKRELNKIIRTINIKEDKKEEERLSCYMGMLEQFRRRIIF